MILTAQELYNIAKTVYDLMTGIYDLTVFKSPYNELIPNEYADQKEIKETGGKATEQFYKVYETIYSLEDFMNLLNGTEKEEYEIFEEMHYIARQLLEELCIAAFSVGFLVEKKYITNLEIIDDPYNNYFHSRLLSSDGIGNKKNKQLADSMQNIEDMFIQAGDMTHKSREILDKLEENLILQQNILVNIAYAHGQNLGMGKYPLWHNPELDKPEMPLNLPSTKNITEENIMKLYCNMEDAIAYLNLPELTKIENYYLDSVNNMKENLSPDEYKQFEKAFFLRTLLDGYKEANTFYKGFQSGLKLAVDVFYREKYHSLEQKKSK